MQQFGQYYRRFYAAAGVLPASGCPKGGSVFAWADLDQRTLASGKALLDGMASGCNVPVLHAKGKEDLLFDPLPSLGKADTQRSKAAVLGAIGGEPKAIMQAYGSAYAALDRVLGCTTGCTRLASVPTTVEPDPDTGLAGLAGGLDNAGTAAENLLLEYADGKPVVGWGRADGGTILDVMQLHALKSRIEHETYENARAEGSNLLAHMIATIDQASSGRANPGTRVPASARFAVIVGHDSSLAKLAGMLHLSWIASGYLFNDTPPGGALVFELYAPQQGEPFVRLFFTAQSLDEMRAGRGTHPLRVPVYIPGCPSSDCPISTFDRITHDALEPRFVGQW